MCKKTDVQCVRRANKCNEVFLSFYNLPKICHFNIHNKHIAVFLSIKTNNEMPIVFALKFHSHEILGETSKILTISCNQDAAAPNMDA